METNIKSEELWFRSLQWMVMDPRWVAEKEEREPRKAPIGVRATPTIQTSVRNKVKARSS